MQGNWLLRPSVRKELANHLSKASLMFSVRTVNVHALKTKQLDSGLLPQLDFPYMCTHTGLRSHYLQPCDIE